MRAEKKFHRVTSDRVASDRVASDRVASDRVDRSACILGPTLLVWLCLSQTVLAAPGPEPEPVYSYDSMPEVCAMLDNPELRQRMDGLLLKLKLLCGRQGELARGALADHRSVASASDKSATDVPVNDPSGEDGAATHTQSETTIAYNETTGTLCSGFNDAYGGINGDGFVGFSRSTDGGATFEDRGGLGPGALTDPSMVWRRADGNFYFATLADGHIGISIWRSSDDCRSFEFVANTHLSLDDKEFLTVDNNPASPYYGRLYIVWADFGIGGRITTNHSADGGVTWSQGLVLTDPGVVAQNAWPATAANGDVYLTWVRWNPFPTIIDIEIVRSTDGGETYTRVANPMSGQVNPRDATATSTCGRPALNGNIRHTPGPQLVIGADGALNVVYSYDPDGFNTGDVVDVFYRKSTDSGTTWDPEVRLNDDTTQSDQFFPTLSVRDNVVATSWYDRRLDADNLLLDHYKRVSADGGTTWLTSERVSDVSTPIYIDPLLVDCYHGDYDQHVQTESAIIIQWSDDRNVQSGHNDPDVWSESMALDGAGLIFRDGFESGNTSAW